MSKSKLKFCVGDLVKLRDDYSEHVFFWPEIYFVVQNDLNNPVYSLEYRTISAPIVKFICMVIGFYEILDKNNNINDIILLIDSSGNIFYLRESHTASTISKIHFDGQFIKWSEILIKIT